MVGNIRTDAERVAPNVMDTTPENQAATFRNQDQVWPVRVIRRGDAVRPLPYPASTKGSSRRLAPTASTST